MNETEDQGWWGRVWEIYQVWSRRRICEIQREELGCGEWPRDVVMSEDWTGAC